MNTYEKLKNMEGGSLPLHISTEKSPKPHWANWEKHEKLELFDPDIDLYFSYESEGIHPQTLMVDISLHGIYDVEKDEYINVSKLEELDYRRYEEIASEYIIDKLESDYYEHR